ncbi:hypothetical protein D3C87_1916840 [compost metagenome]
MYRAKVVVGVNLRIRIQHNINVAEVLLNGRQEFIKCRHVFDGVLIKISLINSIRRQAGFCKSDELVAVEFARIKT